MAPAGQDTLLLLPPERAQDHSAAGMTHPLRPVERPTPLAVPTQRTDTSPCQPQLAHGILGQPTHDPPGHGPVVPHRVPTLDSEAAQALDLNMLPWLFHLATAAQAWLLLPGAEPAYFWGEPAATPPQLQTCRPAQPWPHSPCPCRGPQSQEAFGPDQSTTTFQEATLSTAV